MKTRTAYFLACGALLFAGAAIAQRVKRPGVSTPGVQHSMSELKPVAVFPVEGAPDWLAITPKAVWVSSSPKNHVVLLDPASNQVQQIVDVSKPCSGLAYGFDSIWAPSCGEGAVVRIDAKTAKVTARIPAKPADSEGGIAVGAKSVWIVTGDKKTLSRIDARSDQVTATIEIAEGSAGVVFGNDAVWVTSPQLNVLTKVDPKTNKVTAKISVGPKPRFVAFGDGAVWTLNQGDGTVSRVDAKKATLVKNIEAGIPGPGGEIAFGEGAVWATVFGFPITKIDPKNNAVTKQWKGPGGDSIRIAFHSIWLSCLKEHQVQRIATAGL